MIKNTISKLFASFAIATMLLVPGLALSHTTVAAQSAKDAVCEGVAKTGSGCDTDASAEVDTLVQDIINILSVVVGVVSVIMIIIGGLKYITSGGDSSSVSSAKNTILYAIVGLVIVAFAQIIVIFVLDKVG